MSRKLEGKIAMITGAARGIGKTIATVFAEEGAKLALSDVNEDLLKATAAELKKISGEEPMIFVLNVKDASKFQEYTDKTLDKYKRIDILVNNAGITRDGIFVRMSEADWDDVIAINLKGVFLGMRAVSKVMMKQRYGKIVNMASVIGLIGNAGQANYAASKAGVIALTKSVAKELGSRNVMVNAIAPGFIDTDMTQKLSEDVRNAILKTIPLNAFGKPLDVAKAALFLASDESNFVTGQVITVDGGMVM